MKTLRMSIASLMMALCLVFAGSNNAKAQTGNENVDQVVSGLLAVNVNVNDVVVNDVLNNLITVGDITITDVVDVNNVLNKNEVKILNDFIVTITVDNVLNNLLQNADVITGNQIVVGLLSDQSGGFTLVTETVKRVRNEKVK